MKLEDLYYNKRLIKLLLTEEQIRELLIKIRVFGEKNLYVSEHISTDEDYDKKEYKYKYCCAVCPGCQAHISFGYYSDKLKLENDKINEKDLIYKKERTFECLMTHIIYHIRMNASKEHINILREIYGDKITMALLENYAKRNMTVAIRLKEIVESMKLIEVENGWTNKYKI